MCKVIIKSENQNIDFIIYNILFAESKYYFTIDNLLNRIKYYNDQISKKMVQIRIDQLITLGLVRQKLFEYCTVI